MLENLQNQLDETVNIIDTLPENTKDNRQKKLKYIAEEEMKSLALLTAINNELKYRTAKFSFLKENKALEELQKELDKCTIIDEWSNYNTSYEKLHLDYYLYQLHRYYKNDLENVNDCIRQILDIFKGVGINLTQEDFDYHPYVSKYITMIQNNTDEEQLKDTFEPLYWKLPELIKAIEINFKSIYLKYEKKIDKYFENKHKEYLSKHTDKELIDKKQQLIKTINSTREKDPYYIFNKFVNKEYMLNDYNENDINKRKQLYFNDLGYTFDFLLEFYQVLFDYKLILKYNYLFKDIKELLSQVNTLKDAKKNALKKVLNTEKQIKKLTGKGLFGKEKNPDSYLIKYKALLTQIIDEYTELEDATFKDTIFNNFNTNSSALNALELVSLNYLHFINKLKEVDDNEELDNINSKYNELKDILNNNNFVLLDKLSLLDEYQLKQVIVDKYVLDGVKLTKEQLEADSIDKTLADIKILINNEYIIRSGLKLEDIKLYFDVKSLDI